MVHDFRSIFDMRCCSQLFCAVDDRLSRAETHEEKFVFDSISHATESPTTCIPTCEHWNIIDLFR